MNKHTWHKVCIYKHCCWKNICIWIEPSLKCIGIHMNVCRYNVKLDCYRWITNILGTQVTQRIGGVKTRRIVWKWNTPLFKYFAGWNKSYPWSHNFPLYWGASLIDFPSQAWTLLWHSPLSSMGGVIHWLDFSFLFFLFSFFNGWEREHG